MIESGKLKRQKNNLHKQAINFWLGYNRLLASVGECFLFHKIYQFIKPI